MEEEPHYFFFLFWLVITHALGGSWILNPFYHLAVTREGVTYELELIGEDEPHYILFLHSTPTQHSKNGCWIPPQTTSQQSSTCTFCRWVDDTRRYDKHWVPKKKHIWREHSITWSANDSFPFRIASIALNWSSNAP